VNSSRKADSEPGSEPISEFLILLGFGSNLGDRQANIRNAVKYLENNGYIYETLISNFYESEPIGYSDQPWFLNSAALTNTRLNPNELMSVITMTENHIGRVKRKKWHEREIDIDILLFDCLTVDTVELIIPHPEFHTRKFALLPASEIAPELIHPIFNLSVNELLSQCKDSSVVKLY
jgi:2-amino-4-hydroxy-6-hydroxymethyldihydropteridine diphosphokinase